MNENPMLRKADVNDEDWVTYLQQLLQALGYWDVEPNGQFDDELEQAVMRFQSDVGLVADGVVDANTWNELTTQQPGAPAADYGDSAGEQHADHWEETAAAMQTTPWQEATTSGAPATFEELWANDQWREVYAEWARTNRTIENVQFLRDVEDYRNNPNRALAESLFRRYFTPNSAEEVNVPANVRHDLEDFFAANRPAGRPLGQQRIQAPANLFDEAYREIFGLLKYEYRNFLAKYPARPAQRDFLHR